MKKFLLALLCMGASAQVVVTPITQPHVTFVNASGGPCASCTLQSYIAGTTTPLATYTDANGVSQNTNPIILDAAGGANIWLGNNSYKFILKTAAGTTIWTVDQVKGGGGLGGICGPSGAIQIANTGVNGVTCDSSITINTSNHTINVGTLTANHITIGALGTATSWTFDTTNPATARASIGAGSVTSVAVTVPSWLTATGNPITDAGTIGIAATAGLPANQFLATPNGAAGALTPRTIAAADLPLGTNITVGALKCDGTSISCTAGVISTATASAATCNSNGCYITLPGGTIMQWGKTAGCGGSSACNVPQTFPTPFTTTTNLSIITSESGGGANNYTASVGSPSTTSFNVQYAALVMVGGSGSNLPGSQTAYWFAIGQ